LEIQCLKICVEIEIELKKNKNIEGLLNEEGKIVLWIKVEGYKSKDFHWRSRNYRKGNYVCLLYKSG